MRRFSLALILLLVALHPLAHEEHFSSHELTISADHHASAECPCIRGGALEVETPSVAAHLTVRPHVLEYSGDGYSPADRNAAVPSRAPPAAAC